MFSKLLFTFEWIHNYITFNSLHKLPHAEESCHVSAYKADSRSRCENRSKPFGKIRHCVCCMLLQVEGELIANEAAYVRNLGLLLEAKQLLEQFDNGSFKVRYFYRNGSFLSSIALVVFASVCNGSGLILGTLIPEFWSN